MFCPNCGKACKESDVCTNCGQNLANIRKLLDDALFEYIQFAEDDTNDSNVGNNSSNTPSVDSLLKEANLLLQEKPEDSFGRDTNHITAVKNFCPKCKARNYRTEYEPVEYKRRIIHDRCVIVRLFGIIIYLIQRHHREETFICLNCGHRWKQPPVLPTGR